jgi:hypothetical protein
MGGTPTIFKYKVNFFKITMIRLMIKGIDYVVC